MDLKNTCFIKSIRKADKRLLYVFLLDLAVIILILLSIALFNRAYTKFVMPSEEVKPSMDRIEEFTSGIYKSEDIVKYDIELIRSEFYSTAGKLGATAIIILAIAIIGTAFLKSYGWSLIKKDKYNLKYFKRFFLTFIVWNLAAIILIVAFGIWSNPATGTWIILVLFILYFYLNYIIFIDFSPDSFNLWSSIRLGITKIHKFILPLIIIFILTMLADLLWLVPNDILSGLLYYFALFLILSWSKFYIYEVYNKCLS